MSNPFDTLNSPLGAPPSLTVSQLNRQARMLLESHFDFVWVEGEISNFVVPSSGHWYFSLKDGSAQVRCAMFRPRNQRVKFTPKNGDHIRLRCRVSLYEGRGEFQLIVEHLEHAGAGALQAAAKSHGISVQVFGLSSDNARAFWNWQFLADQPNLPATRSMLMRACDVRLPARLQKPDLDFIIKALTEAAKATHPTPAKVA